MNVLHTPLARNMMIGIGALGFSVIFLLTVLQPPRTDTEKNEEKTNQAIPINDQKTVRKSNDEDGDGLYDWEEILHRTDPNQSDTDRDGTSDGEEIKNGLDPLTPGPNDITLGDTVITRLEKQRVSSKTPARNSAPGKETTSVTPAQNTPTPAEVQKETAPAENTELRRFGNALAQAIQPAANETFQRKVSDTLQQVLASPGELKSLPELTPIAETYRLAARAVGEIVPPPLGTIVNAKLQKGYGSLADILTVLSAGSETSSALGEKWTRYSDAALELGKALNETIGFFAEHRITFTQSEPGDIFNAN